MAYDEIFVESSDRGVTIVLDRPEKKNALTGTTFAEIGDAVKTAVADSDTGVVTIRGSSGDFSAGVDLNNVPEWIDQKPLEVRDQLEEIHGVLDLLETVDVPVVAALEGYVLGGALELAISCDLRVATRGATFGLPESKLGLAINYGGAQKLPGLIGEGMTKRLIMTGENIDGDRAHEIGLVEELVNGDELDDAVTRLERALAEKPRYVHGFAKRQVRSVRPPTVEEGMQQAIHHAIAAYQEEETKRRSLKALDE